MPIAMPPYIIMGTFIFISMLGTPDYSKGLYLRAKDPNHR
jgi:hypothetical protein